MASLDLTLSMLRFEYLRSFCGEILRLKPKARGSEP